MSAVRYVPGVGPITGEPERQIVFRHENEPAPDGTQTTEIWLEEVDPR